MARYTLIDRSTVGKTAKRYLFISLASAIAAGTYLGISTCARHATQSRNAAQVRSAIADDDTELADRYVRGLGKTDCLNRRDIIALTKEIEERRAANTIDRLIERMDIDAARNALAGYAQAGIFPSSKTQELSQRIEGVTEEGLYKRILKNPDNRQELCSTYIAHYPKGRHNQEVATDLISEGLETIGRKISSNEDFSDTYMTIVTLEETIAELAGKGLKPRPFAHNGLDTESIEAYLDGCTDPSDSPPKLGDRVRFRPGEDPFFPSDYISERNSNFPQSAIGIIIAETEPGSKGIVRFDSIGQCTWSKDWNPDSKYWSDDKKNAAEFEYKELVVCKPVSGYQKDRFRQAVAELDASITSYMDTHQKAP